MLIMLGRLSEPPVSLQEKTLFLTDLSTFTWKRFKIRQELVICFLDSFSLSWYNLFVIFHVPYD